MKLLHLLSSSLLLTNTLGFSLPKQQNAKATKLYSEEGINANPVASFSVAAAIFMASFAGDASEVMAAQMQGDSMLFGTDQVIAARSGGRAGGRAVSGRSAAPRPSSRPTTVNNYNSYGSRPASPTVIVTPSVGYGYGYSPFGYGGLGGVGLGLDLMGGFGREMREIQEQRELAKTRAELDIANQRQADLEARMRAMEAQQRGNPVAPVAPVVPQPVQ